MFDIVKTEVEFPFVSAFAFRYLCKYEDRMRLGNLCVQTRMTALAFDYL